MAEESGGSRVVVIAAMAANFIIMVAKFGAAVLTGSSAMASEGIHSLADTGNQALLLLGEKRSKRPPDDEHPFGHGQELYFWALIVAIVLFGIGGGLSIFEGTYRLLQGSREMKDPFWSYVVLGIAALAEGTSWVIAMKHVRKRRHGRSIRTTLHQLKDPKLFIPAGEDSAALVGIAVAFLGIFLSHRFHAEWFDSAASIVIGLILCAVAFWLARETKGLLVGERVEPALRDTLGRVVRETDGVHALQRALSMHLSSSEILLNLELDFEGNPTQEEMAATVGRIEERLRSEDGRLTRIFIEPGGRTGGNGRTPPF